MTIRTLVAVGDVVVGRRWWNDVEVFCRRGVGSWRIVFLIFRSSKPCITHLLAGLPAFSEFLSR